jgi:hypothetical protein
MIPQRRNARLPLVPQIAVTTLGERFRNILIFRASWIPLTDPMLAKGRDRTPKRSARTLLDAAQ